MYMYIIHFLARRCICTIRSSRHCSWLVISIWRLASHISSYNSNCIITTTLLATTSGP